VQCLAWHSDQVSFHAPATSGSGNPRLANAYAYFEGTEAQFRSVAWSHDQRYILSASHDRSVRIGESETGRCFEVLTGRDKCAVYAVWTPDRESMLSCYSRGGLRTFTFVDSVGTPSRLPLRRLAVSSRHRCCAEAEARDPTSYTKPGES
jgi:WD40 repeat protein